MQKIIFVVSVVFSISKLHAQHRYLDNVFTDIHVEENIAYGLNFTQSGEQQTLKCDIYFPDNDSVKNRPLIILAHGGYFLGGDKKDISSTCYELAMAGYVVASINYRLIDVKETEEAYKRAGIDAIFDMKASVRFFRKSFEKNNEYGIDTSAIFIGGYSAGAITALHYAYVSTMDEASSLGGQLLTKYIQGCGGLEGNSGSKNYSSQIHGVINIAGALHHVELVEKNEPPLFSVHGTMDDIVPYETGVSGESGVVTQGSKLIHDYAKKVGLKNELISIKEGDHFSFFSCENCMPELRKFLVEIIHDYK